MRLLLYIALFTAQVSASNLDWSAKELEPLTTFFTKENIPESQWPNLVYVQKSDLPAMQKSILTQPLLTTAIADYYQRTPKIRAPLHIDEDLEQNQFYRAIIMIVDKNGQRDNALLADTLNESRVVELGLISIDFNALPQTVIEGVRIGETPFGNLLLENKVQTHSINTRYFKVTCDQQLEQNLKCELGQILYGRSNTIVRDDNNAHIAHVVEILTGA
ncbi:MAG: hypothetical protein WC748_03670 [Legionellales bacterium]|jgi:hypothetical protein